MMRIFYAWLILIAWLLGCSSSNPTMPSLDVVYGGGFSGSIQSPNRSILGFYKLSITADRSEVEIIPDRMAMIHLNTVRLIETDPCTDCLSVENFEPLGEGRILVDIELKHPFSAEHPKLTAFDVRGIVMLPGSFTFPGAGVDVSLEANGDPVLVGPDGYTRLFNPEEFPEGSPGPPALNYITGKLATPGIEAATLNPYLMFAETEERHHFAPNHSYSRTYDLKLPPGTIEVGYAVDCCWELVDGTVDDIPEDFPLSANCLEAYRIFVSIGKGLTPTGTGTANVRVDVYDWQGLDTIDKVLIECPALYDGDVEASFSTVEDEAFVFYGQIQNEKLAPIGDYPLLVTVEDKYEDADLGPVAAYQLATAHVTLTGVWIKELVYIPAGDFIMGSDPDVDPQANDFLGEMPQHIHWTDEFYIGKYEITNEEFMAFITDGGYENPAYWSAEGWEWKVANNWNEPQGWGIWNCEFGPQFPDYPAWNLRWYEAEAFCIYAGGRLPSEPEWEGAARGTDGRIFPWGNEWDPTKCRSNANAIGPLPVGSYSPVGDGPFGLSDSMGNASEYTSDWWVYHIYDQYATGDFTPPSEPDIENVIVVRGGNFGDQFYEGYLRCASRNPGLINDAIGGGRGFRIVFNP